MSISLLSILLFALVSPVIIDFTIFHDQQHSIYYSFIFGLLIFLPVLDIYRKKFPIFIKLRPILVWLIIAFTVGFGAIVYIYDRHKISPAYRVNDIVIQQEVATRMFLTHKNPYKETYFNTPLEEFKFSRTEENPALYHFVMEPFYLESIVPFYFIQSHVFGYFDSRAPLYLLFLSLLIGGYLFIKDKENKLLFITIITFNPMTLRFLLEGRSDMFMFPFLFFAFMFLHKKRFAWAVIFAAFAFAIKQTAWPIFPLLAYFMYLKIGDIKPILKYLVLFSLVFGACVLPFFIWNPHAFLDSTVFYLTGNTAHSYPISGYGFSTLLKEANVIKDTHQTFPFFIFQLIFAVPVLIILLKYLKSHPTTKTLITIYAIFLAVVWYFSRYFNNSHIGYISTVLITAYFWPEEDKKEVK